MAFARPEERARAEKSRAFKAEGSFCVIVTFGPKILSSIEVCDAGALATVLGK